MTIQSGFFNSINGDRRYDANWFSAYFASFIGNGVFPNPSTGLQVVEGNNMNIVVKAGKGWINGYFVVNDGDYTLTLDNADGVLKRIDRVVMRLNYLTRQIEIVVKKGAFASNPVAPDLQRDTAAYELALADVLINNGVTQITPSAITDTRLSNELCGIVHGVVDQVDTTTLFNQYQSWINQEKTRFEDEVDGWLTSEKIDFESWRAAVESAFGTWMTQEQTDFENWLSTLQDLIDENIAATLTTKVQALEQALPEHSAQIATLETLGHVKAETDENGVLIFPVPETNYTATVLPTKNDDETKGYSVGSSWYYSDENGYIAVYKCLNSDSNNAVWERYVYHSGLAAVPLYINGIEHVHFKTFTQESGNNPNVTEGTVTLYDDFVDFKVKTGTYSGDRAWAVMQTENYIDFSNMNTLYFEYEFRKNSGTTPAFHLIVSTLDGGTSEYTARVAAAVTWGTKGTAYINVSNLKGLYYVRVELSAGNSSVDADARLHRIWGA